MNQKADLVDLADQMGTHDLLTTLKKQQSEYTAQNVSNDFLEDGASSREDTNQKRRCIGKKSCLRNIKCLAQFMKEVEDVDNMSFISQEFSSGESEKEEDMVNYIDERKPYVAFNKLNQRDQVDRLFFNWQMLVKKLRGSIYLIQAFAFLHKSMYVKGTTKTSKLDYREEEEHTVPCYVIMPNWAFKKLWSAIIQIILIYTAIYVPFKLSFIP